MEERKRGSFNCREEESPVRGSTKEIEATSERGHGSSLIFNSERRHGSNKRARAGREGASVKAASLIFFKTRE